MDAEEKYVIPPEFNLVQFATPELITSKTTQPTIVTEDKTMKKCVHLFDLGDDEVVIEELGCNDVLNLILPPREWEKDGSFWRQKISNKPATKLDVMQLGDRLNSYLKEFKAKEVGICPIKRELYGQCFNEIIRQVTLNCAERGYMLIQIRDEINMTIDAYQELYESIIAYGIRKELLRNHKKSELKKKVELLNAENAILESELADIVAMNEEIEREIAEAYNAEVKRHAEEMAVLKRANQQIKAQLESIVAP